MKGISLLCPLFYVVKDIYERRKTSEGIRISESGYICKKEYICDKYNVEQRIL